VDKETALRIASYKHWYCRAWARLKFYWWESSAYAFLQKRKHRFGEHWWELNSYWTGPNRTGAFIFERKCRLCGKRQQDLSGEGWFDVDENGRMIF